CGFHNVGMFCRDSLDFIGIYVEAGDDDHVLFAILDVDVALLVDQTYVPSSQESVRIKCCGCLFGSVPVTSTDLRPAYAYFPDLPNSQFLFATITYGDLC